MLDANHAKRPVQIHRQVKQLNLDSDFAVSSYLSYNAFGEVSEERDERVAERARALLGRELTAEELAAERTSYRYNTLGKLISRTEAQTGVTADNGFAYRDRPVTTYAYDLLGRMTVQMDANGARSVRTLLEGSTDAVVRLANVPRNRIGTASTPMAGDLAKLCRHLLRIHNGAKGILSPATLEAMTTNQLSAYPDVPETNRRCTPWGLGWQLNWPHHARAFGDLLSPSAYGHWGATGTMVWIDPPRDCFAVVLTTQPLEDRHRRQARFTNTLCSALR